MAWFLVKHRYNFTFMFTFTKLDALSPSLTQLKIEVKCKQKTRQTLSKYTERQDTPKSRETAFGYSPFVVDLLVRFVRLMSQEGHFHSSSLGTLWPRTQHKRKRQTIS